MLKLEHVKKDYGRFALDCSMEVREGFVTGLIGKNGAGKTTTFKAILGLIKVDSGNVTVLGKTVDKLTSEDRQEIGVVLSDSGFSGWLTIQDIAVMMSGLYERFQKDTFLQACKKEELPLNKKLKEFSTGMKRKTQILAALSYDAKLLILDEPTAGLDVLARDEILDLLREYMEQGDRAILISSHISSDLEQFCDDIYMIDEGKMVLHEDTDSLLDNYALLKVPEEKYEKLDKQSVLRMKKEEFGYSCLTNERTFYLENYPDIVVEKSGIDELMTLMIRGEKL